VGDSLGFKTLRLPEVRPRHWSGWADLGSQTCGLRKVNSILENPRPFWPKTYLGPDRALWTSLLPPAPVNPRFSGGLASCFVFKSKSLPLAWGPCCGHPRSCKRHPLRLTLGLASVLPIDANSHPPPDFRKVASPPWCIKTSRTPTPYFCGSTSSMWKVAPPTSIICGGGKITGISLSALETTSGSSVGGNANNEHTDQAESNRKRTCGFLGCKVPSSPVSRTYHVGCKVQRSGFRGVRIEVFGSSD